jgi:hypothetical protein
MSKKAKKKRIMRKIKNSRLFPDEYKGAYEKKLKDLEKKVIHERKMLKKSLEQIHLTQLNLSNFQYL